MFRKLTAIAILAALYSVQLQDAVTAEAAQGQWKERLREAIKQRQQRRDESRELVEATLTAGGRERRYLVHVPKGRTREQGLPAVLAFHGGGGSMEYMARDDLYGLISKSDASGFIAVFPNGTGPFRGGKLATWNAGGCCGRAREQNVDDVEFVRAVVADVKQRYHVDASRIYATGMSNGAMMAYRLACEASDLFAGIAAVAGTDNTGECEPGSPVSILHIHAKNDDHVPFEGGLGPATLKASKATNFVSVDATVSKWVKLDHCSAEPVEVLNVPGARCIAYQSCRGGSQVKLCVTETGAHSWPGGRSNVRLSHYHRQ